MTSIPPRRHAFAISVGSLAVGILGLGIGVASLVRQPRPELLVDVRAASDVFDIRESIDDLGVSFRGQDLRAEGRNLRLYTVAITNVGNRSVLQDHYDRNLPWGLRLQPGQVVQSRVVDAGDDYLSRNILRRPLDSASVQLGKVIFDPDQTVVLSLLAIHPDSVEPRLSTFGKIAGADSIRVVESWRRSEGGGFTNVVLRAPLGAHLMRAVFYAAVFLSAVLLALGTFGLAFYAKEYSAKRRRRKIVAAMRTANPEWGAIEGAACRVFVTLDYSLVSTLLSLSEDEGAHRELVRAATGDRSTDHFFEDDEELPSGLPRIQMTRFIGRQLRDELTDLQEVLTDGLFHPRFLETLEELRQAVL